MTESMIPHFAQLNCCNTGNTLPANDLVVVPSSKDDMCTAQYGMMLEIRNQLSPMQRSSLAQSIHTLGGDTFSALGQLWASQAPYDDEAKALFGGLLSAQHTKNKNLLESIERYNQALLEYRNALPRDRGFARNKVKRTFNHLNHIFQQDIKQLSSQHRNSARNPLHNVERGLNIAKDSRNAINLSNISEVQHLKRVIKNTNFATHGLLVMDLGLAGYKVHNTRQAGGDATRVAFEELGGILLGTLGGIATAALVPGVGLILGTTAFAFSTILFSDFGKFIGGRLYEFTELKSPTHAFPNLSSAALSIL
ncbi:MAG: hypothetical protein R3240_07845 [Gammaproteobacteria bacterium]|nr:hypothetical protein [Gammaproteobacteria bacterium]